MNSAEQFKSLTLSQHAYQHSRAIFDEDLAAALLYMQPTPRPCYTPALLEDIRVFHSDVAAWVRSEIAQTGHSQLRYTVIASNMPEVYNLGGDLSLFADLIQRQDRDALLDYAIRCIDVAHQASTSMDLPLTTIALVQGRAQGGGFEAALACNVIIAERGTEMGFPEVLFNLFPGMGAYSFLSRRINPIIAERMILSGRLYTAEELYEMGIVDHLAEPGKGKEKLKEYIRESERHNHAHSLIRHVRNTYNRVTYEELLDITQLWVESALRLTNREIKTMRRLVSMQDRKATMKPQDVKLRCAE